MMNIIATTIVFVVVLGLVAAMIFMVRITGDDSGKHSELKQFAEALLGGGSSSQAASKETPDEQQVVNSIALQAAAKQPFSEPCPACGEAITHQDVDCPSCGLRLL
ncbi:hypothetical protein A8990_12481 [Paenibacillus taihuensis]|uniref:Uncharacterized protein n=1 Tax=Paenibacillus taihuensis TaxID=1156355 RepID=A0A3D9RS60_9BACL|nr:hypothetical protein [Paenibacillus taihuensis]REE78804.1 hypothetical protein A8990_12481 [Paenibacillus taihuensis]